MSEVTPSVPDLKNEPPKKQFKFDILPLALACGKLLSSWLALWGLGYYRFSPSWIALGAVTYLTYTRMRQKRALISGALKAIGLNEKQSILNNIGAHELPSWVYFPDVERAEWLNKVIHRMWPFITDYVTDILLKTVEPAVNGCLPASLQPFTFLRTDLGDTPPRIGGVKVYTEESIRRDEIVMDVDVMFYSDARIKVSVGKVIAGIKEFEGVLRINVVSASDLVASDINIVGKNASDPYCVVRGKLSPATHFPHPYLPCCWLEPNSILKNCKFSKFPMLLANFSI
ncbi:unnamed protein product [Dibothriocephalus latus]|uniref:SMP-LTD domain-containing protein n=1 Tax=Dibothriocephalus latus TaxID=60516 RepID=A0A3P7P8D2_DIBLA|nr:unnamed protein product [Dibothriocephalus latus]